MFSKGTFQTVCENFLFEMDLKQKLLFTKNNFSKYIHKMLIRII